MWWTAIQHNQNSALKTYNHNTHTHKSDKREKNNQIMRCLRLAASLQSNCVCILQCEMGPLQNVEAPFMGHDVFSRLYTSVWLWYFSSPSHFYLHPWNIKNILTRAASSINQNGACVFRKGVVRGGNHLAAGSSVRNSRCRSQKTTTKRLAWDLSTTMFGILLAVPSPMCQNNPETTWATLDLSAV